MAKRTDSGLSGLRKTVAAHVRRMIRLGLAAQTLSSAGGSQLAISRLITSGVALAAQLQRGLVVRVVGAPLVRRRPQRRSRGASPEDYLQPLPAQPEAAALDQEATGWEDVVPPSLAFAEIESQPFSLARALPSIVAAQQSTFRALLSVNVAVARAVGSTSFAPMTPRASPSSTSLEPVLRGSPDGFPEGPATGFAEAPALAIGAAFRREASSMVFNLSSAAHGMTNLALGTQAVGAGFSPQQPRVVNEGTGFAASSRGQTSPSLLQQSITGSADTSFRGAPAGGSNQGFVSSGGDSSSSPGTAQPSSSAGLPLSRESNPASDLSAGVGGPLGVSPQGPAPSGPAAAGAELNAGPYTVPNGFSSVFSSPAFAAGSKLSMQVRSFASAGPPSQLPLRASEAPSPAASPALAMTVVPEQYPSSYPAGAAYSVSGIVASLGLVERAFSSAASPGFGGAGGGLAREEAPGMEDTAKTVGGAFVGESLDARSSATSAASVAPAETAPSEPDLVAEEGGRVRVPSSDGLDAKVQAGLPRAEPFHYRQVFGERWLASLAEVAAMGRAMMSRLTVSRGSPSPGASLPKASHAQAPGVSFAAGAPGLRAPSPGAELVSGPASSAQASAGGHAQVAPGRASLLGRAIPPPETERGTEWQEIGRSQSALQPLDSAPSAQPREPVAVQARDDEPSRSVWEAVTRLPGILTPSVATPLDDQGRTGARAFREPRSTVRSESAAALPFETSSSPAALGVLRLASSMRDVLVAASSAVLGAPAPAYSSLAQRGVARSAPTLESAALLERSSGPSFERAARARPGQIGRFAASTERQVGRVADEADYASALAVSNLPALQAAVASRSLLAARVTGAAAKLPSLAGAAIRPRPDAVQGLTTTEAASVPGAAPSPSGQPTRRDGVGVLRRTAKGTAWREIRAQPSGPQVGLSSPLAELPLVDTSSPAQGLSRKSVEEDASAEKPAIEVAPPSAGGVLGAAIASRPLGRGGEPERVFFGLDVVAQTLSLASKVPSAAALSATVVAAHPRIGRRTASAVERQSERKPTPEAKYQVEQSPLLLEGWKSAPEEALNKMLGEPPHQVPGPSVEPAAEPDDRELRRRIEKILDEELRRHGYQQ